MIDSHSLHPGTTLKHYEIVRGLGAGSMGTVFLARDIRLGRLVALKLLQKQAGLAIERFLSEARLTALCRHENIVVIYDVDTNADRPYLVLEYVEGRTLRDVIAHERNTGMTASVAVGLILPVARALAFAHEMGIVHRDLKPENILVSNTGQVKVVDFGIAKQMSLNLAKTTQSNLAEPALNTPLTQDGVIVGTTAYMSPEQWHEAPIDGRTDIWALGLILFELLKGSHPLAPLTYKELLEVANLDAPMPSAREQLSFAPAVAEIVDVCLQKRKEERMGSAKDFIEALERLGAENSDTSAPSEEQSPFAGLSAFQESDAARFFGRNDDITSTVARIHQQQLVVIAGASGSGKSSFVRAGLVPALKHAGRAAEVFILRPGRRPVVALADVLAFLVDTTRDAEEADGGFAERAVADTRYCFPIPDGYPDLQAAPLLCAGLIGYRTLQMAGDAERIGIYGFGAAAHIVVQVARYWGWRIFAFVRGGDDTARQFALAMGAEWAGASNEPPPTDLDAALIFAPAGELVPAALRAVRKGGTVVCGGIHMSDIPSFPYSILWGERVLRSVANLTRRDGEEFLALAPRVPVRTEVNVYPLEKGATALSDLRQGRISGAAVLVTRDGAEDAS